MLICSLDPRRLISDSGPHDNPARLHRVTVGTWRAGIKDITPSDQACVMIVSTFSPGQIADYELAVVSDRPVLLGRLPAAAAGLYRRTTRSRM